MAAFPDLQLLRVSGGEVLISRSVLSVLIRGKVSTLSQSQAMSVITRDYPMTHPAFFRFLVANKDFFRSTPGSPLGHAWATLGPR